MSQIWGHFEKLSHDKALCKLCKHEYSHKTTISNLKKHLQHKHAEQYEDLIKAGESPVKPFKKEAQNGFAVFVVQESNSTTTSDLKSDEIWLPPTQDNAYEIIENLDQWEQDRLDKQLLKMFFIDYQPFSIVEDDGFRNFVHSLNPRYSIPSPQSLASLIPNHYFQCKLHIMEVVRNQAKRVCLTIDSWTSSTMETYIAFTANFIVDFELKNILLHCEQFDDVPSSEEVITVLRTLEEEWNLKDKITLVVSNNSEYIINAINRMGWPFLVCFIHKFNQVVVKSIELIDDVVIIVKKIVAYFVKDNTATEKLIKYQTDFEKKRQVLHLKQSDPSHWISIYRMLQRFLQLKVELQAVIPNLTADLPVMTTEFWENISQICKIFKPLEEIAKIMKSTQYLTAGLALVMIDGLKNVIQLLKLKNVEGIAKDFLTKLDEGLCSSFPEKEVEDSLLLGVCTLFDPRFKIHVFNNLNISQIASKSHSNDLRRGYVIKEHALELTKEKIREKDDDDYIEDEFISMKKRKRFRTSTAVSKDTAERLSFDGHNIDNVIENISIWSKINSSIDSDEPASDDIANKARNELDMYMNEELIDKKCCPLNWWKCNSSLYPHLSEVFTEHFHVVVTSVKCDTVFSKMGSMLNERRRYLSAKLTKELVFLNCNFKICEAADNRVES